MSDPIMAAEQALPQGPAGRVLHLTCQWAAMAGASVFVAIVLMSVVSITGRKLWSQPVPGDVEMLQMCAALASASFFAWAHLSGSDVKVDFFTAKAPARVVHLLDALGSALFMAVGALLAWRSWEGALMVREAGERSMLLDWPLWVPQMAMVPGFALMALAGAYRAMQHLQVAQRGTTKASTMEVQS